MTTMQDTATTAMQDTATQEPTAVEPVSVEDASGARPAAEGDFGELEEVDFLDDIDFSLDDVESRIAPLALAHT